MKINEREKRIHNAIRAHFDISPELKKLRGNAIYDLFYGPGGDNEDDFPYPGFVEACERLRDEIDLHEVWVDDQSEEVVDKEPTFCDDRNCDNEECDLPLGSDYTHYDVRSVKEIVFGKELARYI